MAKLYFKFGTMGSSKTAQALMTKFNYEQKNMKVLLMKPSLAVRDKGEVRSRIGLHSECLLIKKDSCLLDFGPDYSAYSVVIVDEAQFLTKDQVDDLRYVADELNIPVFCYGLRTDFQTNLFEGSKRLFETADSIEDIKNICSCGNKAIYNARINEETGLMVLEGETIDKKDYYYEPKCSHCYKKMKEESEAFHELCSQLSV